MSSDRAAFAVVILAAGASSRMGQPKMLLPWGDTTVLGHVIAQWTELKADQVAVVTASHDKPVSEELDRRQLSNRIFNDNPADGMFSSVRSASKWTHWDPAITHWILTLGDQPHLQKATLSALLDFARKNDTLIVQPSFNGRPRHPVILPKIFFQQLRDTRSKTLKDFLAEHHSSISLLEAHDAGLDLDLDFPDDYRRAKKIYFDAR